MKRTILILMAVAILGSIGFYAASRGKSSSLTLGRSTSSSSSKSYKDGTFKGDAAETPYGAVQISITIDGGKINNVKFLKMPHDEGRSQQITADSEPLLKATTIDKQAANIDFVSGATSTSYGYQESLQAALDAAQS